jgi:hypothetical protein
MNLTNKPSLSLGGPALAALLAALALAVLAPSTARAQMPSCTGADPAGATAAFEAGNALMTEALTEIRGRHVDRARARATEALAQFDRQCELGDASALAERGAALMLMGEPLRSAQSYDAFLAHHPLDSLDARTRRRTEPNLQPGAARVSLSRGTAHLFIDDLDFGALPRGTDVHVPLGEHRFEARDDAGTVLASQTATFTAEAPAASVDLFLAAEEPVVAEVTPEPVMVPVHRAETEPVVRQDYTLFYVLSGVGAAVGAGLGITGLVAADDRAQTYNRFCLDGGYGGCDAVLGERDSMLGLAVGGFVLAGLGAVALVVVLAIDAGQPRERVRVAFGPGSLSLSGSF